MAKQQAIGKSKEVQGDFTFLYTVWFYCVHILIAIFTDKDSEKNCRSNTFAKFQKALIRRSCCLLQRAGEIRHNPTNVYLLRCRSNQPTKNGEGIDTIKVQLVSQCRMQLMRLRDVGHALSLRIHENQIILLYQSILSISIYHNNDNNLRKKVILGVYFYFFT